MTAIKLFALYIYMLSFTVVLQDNVWHGIMPLHSTRADVERLLGPPNNSGTSYDTYNMKDEKVFIQYSDGTCEASTEPGRWNVPRDTVISISVDPRTKPKFADFKFNETKYHKEEDDHSLNIIYYRSDEQGIRIEVNKVTGLINGFVYYPTVKDSYLTCPPQPINPDDVGGYCSRKFDWYPDIPGEKEKGRLNQFAEQLQFESAKGYIIYYTGKQTDSGQAQTRAEGAKAYLVSARGIEAQRIIVMNGGQGEKLMTELWVRPKGCRAPTAPLK